jgi:hypothetical protein
MFECEIKTYPGRILLIGIVSAIGALAQPGGWYKGDLHSHSTYSDGDSNVATVLASASSKGLDFFALTDHDNDLNGQPRHWADPDYVSRTMVLLYGIEWSTGRGHANVLAAVPISYEPIWQANRAGDPSAAAAAAAVQGALFSINHPGSLLCCRWEYPVPEGIKAVEVWNSMYQLPGYNRWAGHQLWDGLLRAGRKVSGIGGSDTHHVVGWQSLFFGHGNPATWVFAEARNATAIVHALTAGRASISYSAHAPRLELSADGDGNGTYETMMGGSISSGLRAVSFRIAVVASRPGTTGPAFTPVELPSATVTALREGATTTADLVPPGATSYLARVYKGGILYRVFRLPVGSGVVTFQDIPGTYPAYYRVELTGRPEVPSDLHALLYGDMIAMTNPIYAGY